MGDGDGWVHCAAGHRHWGRYGAAGLLITDGARTVLQHRAAWTHEGDTWGLPGGARDSHEDPVSTALREAYEEAGIAPDAVRPNGLLVDDHGGWSYTTVLAEPAEALDPRAANAESNEIRWWDDSAIDSLPLHRGFAGTWPLLRGGPRRLHVVVDAANVVGSRPDGWWHDRLGANRRLRDRLEGLARYGLPTGSLPDGIAGGTLAALLPLVLLVVEGEAVHCGPTDAPEDAWWAAALQVHPAPADGDAAVAALAEDAARAGRQVVVVTADRGLRTRLDPRVITAGPSWLWRLVDGA